MTATNERNAHLRDMLFGRRCELQDDVQRRMRDGRTDKASDVHDELERTDAGLSDYVEFAVIQMKTETMSRINEALARLDAGEYGCCSVCGAEISETRLSALPFAVRCKPCEERREQTQAQTRRLGPQHATLSPG